MVCFVASVAEKPRKSLLVRWWLGASVVALILAWSCHSLVIRAGVWLVVADSTQSVDAAVVLSGAPALRVPRAARLYRNGHTRRIILTTMDGPSPLLHSVVPSEHEQSLYLLSRLGVPDSAVLVLADTVASTRDEARAVASRLPFLGRRIAIVTSDIHTRRARCVFRNTVAENIEVVMLPTYDPRYDLRSWWRTEAGLVAVFLEWATTLYHHWC